MPALASSPRELTGATAVWSAVDKRRLPPRGGAGGVAIAAAGTGAVMAAAAILLAVASLLAARVPSVAALPADDAEGEDEGSPARSPGFGL